MLLLHFFNLTHSNIFLLLETVFYLILADFSFSSSLLNVSKNLMTALFLFHDLRLEIFLVSDVNLPLVF